MESPCRDQRLAEKRWEAFLVVMTPESMAEAIGSSRKRRSGLGSRKRGCREGWSMVSNAFLRFRTQQRRNGWRMRTRKKRQKKTELISKNKHTVWLCMQGMHWLDRSSSISFPCDEKKSLRYGPFFLCFDNVYGNDILSSFPPSLFLALVVNIGCSRSFASYCFRRKVPWLR